MSGGIIPNGIEEKITFIQTHADLWTNAPPEDIGLDAAFVSEVFALGNLAATKQDAAEQARVDSVQATSERNDALNAAVKKTAIGIQKIRTFAEESADPGAVYTAAGIPAPQTPRELKAPPAPISPVVTLLNTTGDAYIQWKNPTSLAFEGKTFFLIERRLTQPTPGSGLPVVAFTQIGVSHDRDYTDTTIPSGYGEVAYRIIASRNGFNSRASEFATLLMGVSGVSQVTQLTPNGAQTLKEEAA